jgi:hypothetical protein
MAKHMLSHTMHSTHANKSTRARAALAEAAVSYISSSFQSLSRKNMSDSDLAYKTQRRVQETVNELNEFFTTRRVVTRDTNLGVYMYITYHIDGRKCDCVALPCVSLDRYKFHVRYTVLNENYEFDITLKIPAMITVDDFCAYIRVEAMNCVAGIIESKNLHAIDYYRKQAPQEPETPRQKQPLPRREAPRKRPRPDHC